ncbi:MAG: hypothetical protein ACTHL1_11445 [Burkholderiaceae bacterium]
MVTPVDPANTQPVATTQDAGGTGTGSTDDQVSALITQSLIQMTFSLVGNMPKPQKVEDVFGDSDEENEL